MDPRIVTRSSPQSSSLGMSVRMLTRIVIDILSVRRITSSDLDCFAIIVEGPFEDRT